MGNRTIYQQNGYRDRQHYLEWLAEDYGVDMDMNIVTALTTVLPESEDFDGLVSELSTLSEGVLQ